MNTTAIRCVIFDMDGLLLDTERLYTVAMREVAGRYDRVLSPALKARVMGRPAMDSARDVVSALGLPISAEVFLAERDKLLRELFPAADSKPGARALVTHLHRHGVKQGVATSSPRALYDLKVRRHRDWFALFDCVVSVEDPGVARGKPAPDVFLAAACRLSARPAECLAFEDSPAGVSAAIAAGMAVVAIPGPEVGRDSIDGAAEVLDSLEEFRPERWGLPAF